MNYTEMGMFGVGVGVGVIPLLSTTPSWQTQTSYLKKTGFSGHGFGGGGGGTGGGVVVAAVGSTVTCQDCGNQAKKDCTHRRCRTCCKSRDFECATHVKSTWVPAARRRERQLVKVAAAGSSVSTSAAKKQRISSKTNTTSHTSTSNTTPRSFDTSYSHHQQGTKFANVKDASYMESMPDQVRAPAVFKCVRVTAVDDGDDEYAYQARVTIGGHLFKGFLYDQGVETRDKTSILNFSELHLGGGRGGKGRNVGDSLTSPPLQAPVLYGTLGGGLIG